jgi:tryptophanyl-tRNA synthetase
MRATTDSGSGVDFETMGPGVANLLAIFQSFSGWSDDQMRTHFTGMRYGDLKKQVAEMTISQLEPMQQRYREITADPSHVDRVLHEGAQAVLPTANATVQLVKERMGIYTPGR